MAKRKYKKLRKHRWLVEGLPEMASQTDYVLSIIRRCRERDHIRALENVEASINDFAQTCIACAETSIERSVLIEKQIDQHDFLGQLHDDYHANSASLRAQYNSAVQNAKRLANSVAPLIYESLPADQRVGLKSGSFGKLFGFLNRMGQEGDDREPLRSFRTLVLFYGGLFEATVHKYRDKVLEHVHPNLAIRERTIVRDDRVVLKQKRPRRERSDQAATPFLLDPVWPGFVYSETVDGQGNVLGHAYYVHEHIRPEFDGQTLKATDEPIHLVTDGGSGHFDRYGPHSHVFPSSDLPTAVQQEPQLEYQMPGVQELLYRYLYFVGQVLKVIERHPATS